jgi:hypothetical protein
MYQTAPAYLGWWVNPETQVYEQKPPPAVAPKVPTARHTVLDARLPVHLLKLECIPELEEMKRRLVEFVTLPQVLINLIVDYSETPSQLVIDSHNFDCYGLVVTNAWMVFDGK